MFVTNRVHSCISPNFTLLRGPEGTVSGCLLCSGAVVPIEACFLSITRNTQFQVSPWGTQLGCRKLQQLELAVSQWVLSPPLSSHPRCAPLDSIQVTGSSNAF